MRSALICVFFMLVVQRDGSCISRAEHEEEFKPTPIPLGDWPRDKQRVAETLQEIIKTEAPTTAAVPAHYWENALRHSVYLTLVRDKIDQLIAQGDYLSLESRPENQKAKEIDDHDLWDKIKTARFDSLNEEPIPPADVTILAKGRLIQDEKGYRFIEDALQSNCSDSNCMQGVKAFWSVKRIRHREASSGKYHYELTFSVTSQSTRKVNKPYENPVRTFTIKETTPPIERIPARTHGKTIYRHNDRPQRALWVHRNLPLQSYQKQPPPKTHGLDRIFSSLFADEDSYADAHRFKPKTYLTNVHSQQAGHADNRDPYHQKKMVPYPMAKPQPFRSSHSPPTPPGSYVQNPYLNVEPLANPHVMSYIDNRYLPSNVVKTTRPAVFPTPITNYPLLKESTIEVPVKTIFNATEYYTTKEPDIVTTYNKMYNQQKQQPMKINYLPDHIRPPVYNAPPGVFVTMDKKPFKPMPPLKYKLRTSLTDFRPSPQVLDTQFSEQDMSADTAFRPITMNYTNADNINNNNNKNVRKPNTAKKPAKKHENIKSTRLTVATPEIITAESVTVQDISDTEMDWANVLGALTKTTPMASSKERVTKENINFITSTMPSSTIIIEDSFQQLDDSDEDNIVPTSTTTTTTTTTTPKPKKRTRPPPKFNKTDKIKKHKRVTSTTTTTLKPTRTYPTKKPTEDLLPQASSAATSATNSIRETKINKEPASTTTSTTTRRPTPTIKLTTSTSSTTTSTSSTTVDTEQLVVTTQPKSKNRFRQSTLMQKGTSVNHDKWSTSTLDKNRTNTVTPYNYALRRKASKFQGYIPASTPRSPEVERDREDHKDHAYHFNKESVSITTEKIEEDILAKILPPTEPTYEEEDLNDERSIEWSVADELEQKQEKSENKLEHRETLIDGQESKDDNEYIFPTASVIQEVKEYITPEHQSTTELTIVASPYSTKKNKTKCKKKKHNNLTTTEGAFKSSSTTTPKASSTTRTTESPVTHIDIFNELFGGFTMDDDLETTVKTPNERTTPPPEQRPSESEIHENYSDADDLEDFLHSIDNKSNEAPEDDDDDSDPDYDVNSDDEDTQVTFPENKEPMKDDYYEDSSENLDRPYSLLELMNME